MFQRFVNVMYVAYDVKFVVVSGLLTFYKLEESPSYCQILLTGHTWSKQRALQTINRCLELISRQKTINMCFFVSSIATESAWVCGAAV